MIRRTVLRGLLSIALLLSVVPACSKGTVFPNEDAAKTSLANKQAREVMALLGPPDSVATAANPEAPGKYSESWKYKRRAKGRSGELKGLDVYLLRGRVVAVTVEK